jgi:hypothetical protein
MVHRTVEMCVAGRAGQVEAPVKVDLGEGEERVYMYRYGSLEKFEQSAHKSDGRDGFGDYRYVGDDPMTGDVRRIVITV